MIRACRTLAAILLSLSALPLAGLPALAEETALLETARSTYTLRPAGSRILVAIRLTITNRGLERSGRTWGPIYVEDVAARLRSTATSGTVASEVTDLPGPWQRVDLVTGRIPPGESRSYLVEYALTGGASQSSDPFRVGSAFAWFCSTGQPADRGSVTVRLPEDFVPTFSGTPLVEESIEQGTRTYGTGTVDDPDSHFTCTAASATERFVTEAVPGPDGRPLTLQAWPEDAQWLTPARTFVERALPDLRSFIGQRIPGTGTVILRQSPPRELGGYAGAHDQPGVVQLSETVGPTTIYRELAHAWFGADRFPELWLREGMTSWTAASLAGLPCAQPPGGATGLDLGDWSVLRPGSAPETGALIGRQEAAACWIVTRLADLVGIEGMRVVIGSLLGREERYVGSGAPKRTAHEVVDWRAWLDAMDERGLVPAGVDDLDLAQSLLIEYGVPEDTSLLAQRSEARRAYHALLDRAAPLAAPRVVRGAMEEWRFADALAALTVAAEVLDAMSSSDDLLPEAGLIGILQPRFEGAADLPALEKLKREAATLLEQADAVVAPLAELREAAADWTWSDPRIISSAIEAGRFEEARAALTPAISILSDLAAAEGFLPGASIHDGYRTDFEAAASLSALEALAATVAGVRTQAEDASLELAALRSEAGEWALPGAISGPLAAGDVADALSAIRAARQIVRATAEANAALPEADVAALIRPAYESAATAEAIDALAQEAGVMRDKAVVTGAGLERLRASVGDWTLPNVFVDAIRQRDFDTAQKAVDTAQRWIDAARDADSRLSGLNALESQHAAFEAAVSLEDLEAGRVVAERQQQAVVYVTDALARKDDARDLLTQLGLLGSDLEEQTEAALEAAREGDVEAALEAASVLNSAISDATRAGGLRLAGLVFVGVALVGVIGLWAARHRERKPPWARTGKPPWAR